MKIGQNVNDKENRHMQRGALTIQKTYYGCFSKMAYCSMITKPNEK